MPYTVIKPSPTVNFTMHAGCILLYAWLSQLDADARRAFTRHKASENLLCHVGWCLLSHRYIRQPMSSGLDLGILEFTNNPKHVQARITVTLLDGRYQLAIASERFKTFKYSGVIAPKRPNDRTYYEPKGSCRYALARVHSDVWHAPGNDAWTVNGCYIRKDASYALRIRQHSDAYQEVHRRPEWVITMPHPTPLVFKYNRWTRPVPAYRRVKRMMRDTDQDRHSRDQAPGLMERCTFVHYFSLGMTGKWWEHRRGLQTCKRMLQSTTDLILPWLFPLMHGLVSYDEPTTLPPPKWVPHWVWEEFIAHFRQPDRYTLRSMLPKEDPTTTFIERLAFYRWMKHVLVD